MQDRTPANVALEINGRTILVTEPDRPLKITNTIKGKNTIKITWNVNSSTWLRSRRRDVLVEEEILQDVQCEFFVAVYCCREINAAGLLQLLEGNGQCTAQHTRALISQSFHDDEDDDVVMTSLPVSLICPISQKKMRNPCRAITCTHVNCFDGLPFLL